MTNIAIDPVVLGNLEVGWWKAHNDKDKPRMLELLTEYTAAFYGLIAENAQSALKYLIEGVKYHDTREWDSAIDSVAEYYQIIQSETQFGFDPRELAELEVGWWHLHDELEHNPDKSQLADAFALLYAALFGVDAELMAEVGRLKAEATQEHDLAEDPKTLPEDTEVHWNKAEQLLVDCYTELKRVLV